jgi:hypothetical protein
LESLGDMIKLLTGRTPPKIKNNYRWWPYFRVSSNSPVYFHHTTTIVINMTLYSLVDSIVLGLSMYSCDI